MSGSGIRWAICKSAPRSRQITMPAPKRSVFYRPDALLPPNQQCQSTEGKNSLINWQKYFYSVHIAQPTEWLTIHICVINVTVNCFCSRSSMCNPPSSLQFCQIFTDLKRFFLGRLSNKFVKIWLLKNFTTPETCSYTTLWFIVNHDISLRYCFFWILMFDEVVHTRIWCGGIFNNHFIANFLGKTG